MIKNLKKVISTLAAVAILASSASAFAVDFPDVDETASYAKAVETLSNLGIVEGDENGKFNPENTVTRAEFTKMVVEARGLGDSASASTYSQFTDVQGHWSAGYVQTGVAEGFINGYDENTFGPEDKVTYAQAVKMLVAGIGYELWAQEQGGYPAGYLSWGSQLDIIDGISGVNNDTPLTRAQCAVLVNNTLKAPICKVVGYLKDYQGEYYEDYQIMDGTFYNGSAKKYQTLLTEEHDAYVVRGRVMDVDKIKGTVEYQIEKTENFDEDSWDYYLKDGKGENVGGLDRDFQVANTEAANMRFLYSEAIVQKIPGTHEEYTLIAIEEYGTTEMVEVEVKDIAVDGDKNPKVDADSLEVKKEGTAATTTYKLDEGKTSLYVNGTKRTYGSAAIANYLDPAVNKRGTLTLINSTDPGSTSADNKFEHLMVSVHAVGQVTRVRTTGDNAKITTDNGFSVEWSIADEDAKDVTIIKDGEYIEYTDINEDDIVLVSYENQYKDIAGNSADITGSDWVEILVSSNTVSGVATGKSTTLGKEYVIVDGEEYKFNDGTAVSKIELSTEYTLYLDAMGVAYTAKEGETSKNLGVVLAMYKDNAYDELPTVRILTADGEVVKYPVKDKAAALAIDEAVTDNYVNTDDTDMIVEPMSDDGYANAVERADALSNRVIEFTLTSAGALRFKNDMNAAGQIGTYGAPAEYKESTSKLDSYRVTDEDTKMLDLNSFVQDPTQAGYKTITVSDLQDEAKYYAYVYDKKTSSPEYRFALIMEGTTSLTPKSDLAVVTMAGQLSKTEDGDDVQVLNVLTAGSEEPVEVLYEDTRAKITEGTVIMYSVGSEGYVEKGKLYRVFVPAANYKAMMTGIIGATTPFIELQTAADVDYDGEFMKVGDKENTDVKVYYGPVYTAQSGVIEMFVKKADTVSGIGELKTFTPDSETNEYTFNFDAAVGEGYAVSVDGARQTASAYKGLYVVDADGVEDDSKIDWTTVATAVTANEAAPMTAFVREYKNDVTDIVYFIAD